MRGQQRDYARWAELTGDAGWSWDAVLPYFKRHEDHCARRQRMARRRRRMAHREAAPALGHPRRLGAGRAAGRRCRPATTSTAATTKASATSRSTRSAAGAGTRPRPSCGPACMQRANFRLWTGAQVARLQLERDGDGMLRCRGIEAAEGRPARAGDGAARDDPQRRRDRLGADPAAVGHRRRQRWLQARRDAARTSCPASAPTCRTTCRSAPSTRCAARRRSTASPPRCWGKAGIGLQYLLTRSGPMSMAPSQLGAFTRSIARAAAMPNIEYHVQPLSLDAFGEPLHGFDAFTASVCNLNPTSRGWVHIRSPNAEDAPRIAPQLPEHARGPPGGRRFAARHAPHLRAAGAGALPARGMEARACSTRATSSWRGWPATSPRTIFHPVGTTRMGRDDDPMAVLDARCRVRGAARPARGRRRRDAAASPAATPTRRR